MAWLIRVTLLGMGSFPPLNPICESSWSADKLLVADLDQPTGPFGNEIILTHVPTEDVSAMDLLLSCKILDPTLLLTITANNNPFHTEYSRASPL